MQLENNLLAIMETTLKKHKAHGVCLCVQVDAILNKLGRKLCFSTKIVSVRNVQ